MLALTRIYQGWLYARLDECITNIVQSIGRYDVLIHAYTSFLQMFLWEHFRALVPKLVEFATMEMEEVVTVAGTRKNASSLYKP